MMLSKNIIEQRDSQGNLKSFEILTTKQDASNFLMKLKREIAKPVVDISVLKKTFVNIIRRFPLFINFSSNRFLISVNP